MTTSTTTRYRAIRTLAAGTAALLTLALTGCLKVDIDLAVDGDRADGYMIFGVDREFITLMQQLEEEFGDLPEAPPSDSDAFVEEFFGDDLDDFDNVDGATAEEWEDESYVGTRVLFDGVELTEFDDPDDDTLRIMYDADAATYEVTGRMDMSHLEEIPEEDAQIEAELGMPEGFMEELLDRFDFRISITFPGEVREHTGELSGTTVTWRPAIGEDTEIYALASAESAEPVTGADDQAGLPGEQDPVAAGSSGPSVVTALLVALGVLVLVAAGLLVLWLTRRSPAAPRPATTQPPVPEQDGR